MAFRTVVAGSTAVLLEFPVYNSNSNTGALLTGLANNTANLTAYYYRSGAANSTAISLVTMTLGTFTANGFIVVDGTNMPGVYQLGVANAAVAAGANAVTIYLQGASNMVPVALPIQLTTANDYPANVVNWAGNAVTGANGAPPTPIKKNTALANFAFLITDSTLHQPKTGVGTGFTATRSIDGGAFGAGTLANPAEIGNGIYKIDFLAADLNGGVVTLQVTASGADTTFVTLVTAQ